MEQAKFTNKGAVRRHMMDAATHASAVLDCLESARSESRRHVAFWWLDMAASNRRHYAAARAAISKALGN
jgi:hypothetical protein